MCQVARMGESARGASVGMQPGVGTWGGWVGGEGGWQGWRSPAGRMELAGADEAQLGMVVCRRRHGVAVRRPGGVLLQG